LLTQASVVCIADDSSPKGGNGLKIFFDIGKALVNLGRSPHKEVPREAKLSTIDSSCLALADTLRPGAGFVNFAIFKVKLPLGPRPTDKRLKECGTVNLLMDKEG
jgi:hypothetical protein